MRHFSIAGVQMYVTAAGSNVERMQHKIDVVMSIYPWVQMIVFSELSPFGPLLYHAQEYPNATEQVFQEAALRHKIWLIPGSMFRKVGTEIFNTATIINPAGEIIGRYDKMFPFYPYEGGVSAGDKFMLFDVPNVGKFGLSICYDMWFPETSRTLASMGADVIIHPTLTGTIDRDVELAIAQSTAAINQCYVFDVNGIGDGGNGRSIVCGPEGRVQYQANVGEEIFPIELEMDRVARSREHGLLRLGQPLKSFRDRKVNFDIYSPQYRSQFLDTLGPIEKPLRQSQIDAALSWMAPPKIEDSTT